METAQEQGLNQSVRYRLDGLHCIGCTEKILQALHQQYHNSRWEFSLATGILEGLVVSKQHLAGEIQGLVDRYESGVVVIPLVDSPESEVQADYPIAPQDKGLTLSQFMMLRTTRLIIGMFVFIFGLVGDYWIGEEIAIVQRLITIAFYSAYLYVGAPVVWRAFRNIAAGEWFDENFLMTVATFGAIALGELPEALGVMLFYELGEYFQARAVNQSRDSIEKLLAIRPDTAHKMINGTLLDVPSRTLMVGDEIIIKAGERIPVDCILLDESALVDTSTLTGEFVPANLGPDDRLLGGCINLEYAVRCRVEKPFSESTASKLIKLVQQASEKKAKPEAFMTRFAKIYTPIVLLLALLTATLPVVLLGQPFDVWLYRALIFLVISCPCALVISIPLSYFGGIGAASRFGVLVKGGNFLEALANLEAVYYDKTGTLTEGKFEVVQVSPRAGITDEFLMFQTACAEQFSTHPIAHAILRANSAQQVPPLNATTISELAGKGLDVRGQDGQGCDWHIRVGKSMWVKEVLKLEEEELLNKDMEKCTTGAFKAHTLVYVAYNGGYLGHLVLSDRLKANSARTIESIKKEGISVVLLSGDRTGAVEAIAEVLGIEDAKGDLKPEDKLLALEKGLAGKNPNKAIAFIGDGINDAPVIARADVGIAMGALGSEAAIEAADVVFMRDDPAALTDAIHLAKRTRRIVVQNIVMAIGTKVLFLSLGVAGLSGMWEAIFADVGVALLAVLNATRLIPKIK